MIMKVAVSRSERQGTVEYHGLPPTSTGSSGPPHNEAQRIILEPPAVVRDTVALAIRARLTAGELSGRVEGIRWERLSERHPAA